MSGGFPRKRVNGDFATIGFWLDYGLSTRAATAAAVAGCRSIEDLRTKGWRHFQRQENCGPHTLAELSAIIGGWPDAPAIRGPWIKRASDDALLNELRRRGITV